MPEHVCQNPAELTARAGAIVRAHLRRKLVPARKADRNVERAGLLLLQRNDPRFGQLTEGGFRHVRRLCIRFRSALLVLESWPRMKYEQARPIWRPNPV